MANRAKIGAPGTISFAIVVVGAALAFCGCTNPREYIRNGFKVGPNYQKPAAPIAEDWLDSGAPKISTAVPELSRWWKVFNDPALDALVERAYRQNLDIRTAGTRILEARAIRNATFGGLLPQLQQAFGSFVQSQVSQNLPGLPQDTSGITTNFGLWTTGFNLSWELDFWGRFRRALESANADLDAAVENYDDVMVLLIAEVAAAYVEIRTFQARIQYARDNIDIQAVLAKRAEDRFKAGAASKLDLAQMRSNLMDTRALKEKLEIGLRQSNNRLCVLLGTPTLDLIAALNPGPIPLAPPQVAIGIPADLLRRRPDVRRAERQVAAQSARIGIATADLYPHFFINGTMGYQAESLSHLFACKSFFGDVGPGFQWDILNYGRLLSKIRVEDAGFQRQVLTYQSLVLRAGREVEDGLVAFLRTQLQARDLADSAREARIAVDVVADEIKLLKFDINRAFVTANFFVGQQDKLAMAQGDIALSLIQVYKALGGGWELRLQDSCPRKLLGRPVTVEPDPEAPPQPILPAKM